MRILILVSAIIYATPSWSHPSFEEVPAALSAEEYRELIEEAHHAIENEDHAHGERSQWLNEFKEKFEFRKMILNAYRWYSSHQDRPEVANAASNIVAMLLASHFTEVVGGNLMVASGASSGFASWTDWGLTAVGVVIQAPGFDPLCLVLIGSYGKWPKAFDRFLTRPRLFIAHLAQAGRSYVGIPEGWISGVVRKFWREKFQREFHGVKIGEATFRVMGSDGDRTIDLKMRPSAQGGLELETVRFANGVRAMPRPYIKDLLAPFGANIREFILEAEQEWSESHLTDLSHHPFVRQIVDSGAGLEIHVKPGAFPFLDASVLECEGQLL